MSSQSKNDRCWSVGVICDPIDSLSIHKDTSIGLMHAIIRRGWSVQYIDPAHLHLKNNQLHGLTQQVTMDKNASQAPVKRAQLELAQSCYQSLESLDLVLMRLDPPVDERYLKLTWLLDFLDGKVPVFNPPESLRTVNEKLSTLQFPNAVETLVSGERERLLEFANAHESIVIKPLNAMGGRNVYKFTGQDSNLAVLLEDLLTREHTLIAQTYIKAIEKEGDKRVIVIAGQALELMLARIPQPGNHRGNLAANAQSKVLALGETERKIATQVGEWLNAQGIPFAGLDIIGDRLTEINITSPTCVRELENSGAKNTSDRIIDAIVEFSATARKRG